MHSSRTQSTRPFASLSALTSLRLRSPDAIPGEQFRDSEPPNGLLHSTASGQRLRSLDLSQCGACMD